MKTYLVRFFARYIIQKEDIDGAVRERTTTVKVSSKDEVFSKLCEKFKDIRNVYIIEV